MEKKISECKIILYNPVSLCLYHSFSSLKFISLKIFRGFEWMTKYCFVFADRALERVHALRKYHGFTALQRLLGGKPNDCGHYYHGTLSMSF